MIPIKHIIILATLLGVGIYTAAISAELPPPTTQNISAYILGKLKQNDLVLLGERHKQPRLLKTAATLIPMLKRAGVTHLALEIASDQQDAIDRYMQTGLMKYLVSLIGIA